MLQRFAASYIARFDFDKIYRSIGHYECELDDEWFAELFSTGRS